MNNLSKDFSILHRLSDVYLDHQLIAMNLTSKQFMYILCLCDNEGMSQEQLASELRIDKGSVAKTIKQLESKKYVIRKTSSEDRRQYQVYPTKLAKSIYLDLVEITNSYEHNLTKNLTTIETNIFKNLLDKIIENL
jgi:DNA-binding MarR family transcriptional regulator